LFLSNRPRPEQAAISKGDSKLCGDGRSFAARSNNCPIAARGDWAEPY